MTAALQQSPAETIHDIGAPARHAHRPRRLAAMPLPTRPVIDDQQVVDPDGAHLRGSFTVRHGLWRATGAPGVDPPARQSPTDDVDDQARLIAHGIIEVLAGQPPSSSYGTCAIRPSTQHSAGRAVPPQRSST